MCFCLGLLGCNFIGGLVCLLSPVCYSLGLYSGSFPRLLPWLCLAGNRILPWSIPLGIVYMVATYVSSQVPPALFFLVLSSVPAGFIVQPGIMYFSLPYPARGLTPFSCLWLNPSIPAFLVTVLSILIPFLSCSLLARSCLTVSCPSWYLLLCGVFGF